MPPVEDHPDYASRHTQFVTQQAQAQAARDEVAEVKAENAWLTAKAAMSDELSAAQAAKSAHAAAITALRSEFPSVPEAAYAHLTDIKKMKELVTEIAPNFTPSGTPPQGGADPGFTPPSGDGKLRKTVTNPFDDPVQANQIATDARRGDRSAQDRIKREVYTTLIQPKMDKLGPAIAKGRARAGR